LAFSRNGTKLDALCSSDVVAPQGFTVSWRKFVTHFADTLIQAAEIAQRHSEVEDRGPSELIKTITVEPKDEAQFIWSSSSVKVSAIRSTDMPGNVSYRVDTLVGSVVIGGDDVNDVLAPPRNWSKPDQVEKLLKELTSLCIRRFIPCMRPGKGSDMYRCATTL
jgi:ribonuclease Z